VFGYEDHPNVAFFSQTSHKHPILGIWQKLFCEESELNLFSHAVDN
jgi:hypothetical protein